MRTFEVKIKLNSGAYITSAVGKVKASCTQSAECAARRLAEKLGGSLVSVELRLQGQYLAKIEVAE